jgi:hypothetical protein
VIVVFKLVANGQDGHCRSIFDLDDTQRLLGKFEVFDGRIAVQQVLVEPLQVRTADAP